MNTDELKHKYNLVAIIAAIGALIAFIGVILAFTQFPAETGWLDLLVFILLLLSSLVNIKPSVDKKNAMVNVIIGILAIIITAMDYIRIADNVGAQSFGDVGIGVWLMFVGTFLFTIFSVSDYMFKRNE